MVECSELAANTYLELQEGCCQCTSGGRPEGMGGDFFD